MEKRDSLVKNTALLAFGTILTKGLLFVMVPFFSRWLSTEDYGIFDVLCTYVTLLIPVIGLASNEALFRFSMDVETKEEKKKYVSNCLTIFTVNSAIFFLVLLIVRVAFHWELALYFFLLAIGEVYNMHLRGFLRAIKHIDIYSFASAITTVLIAIFVTIFVRVLGMGLNGIILGYAMGYIIGDLLIVLITKYWTYIDIRSISVSGIKELIKYSIYLVPNSIAWWFINVSDRTIIQLVLGAASNGIYAIAYKIPNILSSIFGVFSVSWQQSATESVNDANRDEYYNKVYNTLIATLLTLCCGVLSLNSWLFNYIFDARYFAGHLYAPILIGGNVFSTLSQYYGSIQISLKQPKENGKTTIIGAVANLIVHLALVKFIGLYAAAISTVVSQIVVCAFRYNKLKKIITVRMNKSSIVYFIIYLGFTASAYYITNTYFNIFSVAIATALVIYANRQFAVKMMNKVKKIIHR